MYESPQYPPFSPPGTGTDDDMLKTAVRASPVRRAAAWGVDFGLMVLVAVGLGFVTYERITSPHSSVAAEAASGFKDMVTAGLDIGDVAATTASSVWDEVSALVIQGFLAVIVVQFLYQFVALAWTGRTVGKVLLDLRVVSTADTAAVKPGAARAATRAAATAITDTGLFCLACCVLLSGEVVLSVICWLVAVAAFWGNALPTLVGDHRSFGDLVAGTRVNGAGLYRAVANGVVAKGRVAKSHAIHSARGLSENERFKQAWESQRVQQVRQVGQGAAERGREAWNRFTRAGEQQHEPPPQRPPD